MKLKLKETSWNNIFDVIRNENTKLNLQGNFWASIQFLEIQMKYNKENKHSFDEKATEIYKEIYEVYGSGTGILFGIPSSLKSSVESIIKFAVERNERED